MALRRRRAKRKDQEWTNLGSSLRWDGFLPAHSTVNANPGGRCAFLLGKSSQTLLRGSSQRTGRSTRSVIVQNPSLNIQRISSTPRRFMRLCGDQLSGTEPLLTRFWKSLTQICNPDRSLFSQPDMPWRILLNGQARRLSTRHRGRDDTRFHRNRFQPALLFSRGALSLTLSIHTAMVVLFMCITFVPRPTVASVADIFGFNTIPYVPTNFRIVPRSLTKLANETAEYHAEMGMDMVNCGILSDESMNTWELTTSAFIFESFLLRDEEDLYRLNVTSKTVNQMPILGSRRTAVTQSAAISERSRFRRQQATQPLRVLFDVFVSFPSNSDNHNVEQWIWDAFGTEGQRTLYIFALKETGDKSFDSIQAVTVYARDLLEDNAGQKEQQGNNITLIIVAAVLGGISCITLVGLLGYLRSASKKKEGESEQVEGDSPPLVTNEGAEDDRVVAMIDASNAIDSDAISTLGGSIMSAGFDKSLDGAPHQEEALEYSGYGSSKVDPGRNASKFGEDTTTEGSGQHGAVSIEADSFESESLQINKQSSVVSDDASFERQYSGTNEENMFEVAAPPGKLGVIIDTPENSPPTVFAIKDSSPLAGVVTVGDQLVSVDGANTTKLSSVVVSQLLFDKAENPIRILVFNRGSQY